MKKAFTLAEVLITLAVVGVVAAMTIPTLISKYQKRTTAIKVKKTYAEIYQVVRLSESQNGPMNSWDFGLTKSVENTKTFVNTYLIPYISGINECNTGYNNECGANFSGQAVNYVLKNGIGLSIAARPDDGKIAYIQITIDPHKDSFITGRDVFTLQISDGKLLPIYYQSGLTREILLGDGYISYTNGNYKINSSCKQSANENIDSRLVDEYRGGCTALLYIDGFEFKNDYPW